MTPKSQSRGGGVLIAIGLIVGAVVGILVGESSAGLLLGGLVGAAAAVVLAFARR